MRHDPTAARAAVRLLLPALIGPGFARMVTVWANYLALARNSMVTPDVRVELVLLAVAVAVAGQALRGATPADVAKDYTTWLASLLSGVFAVAWGLTEWAAELARRSPDFTGGPDFGIRLAAAGGLLLVGWRYGRLVRGGRTATAAMATWLGGAVTAWAALALNRGASAPWAWPAMLWLTFAAAWLAAVWLPVVWRSLVEPLADAVGEAKRWAVRGVGFAFDRQRGSHMIYVRDSPPARISSPDYDPIRVGTLRAILWQVGLTVEEFMALL